MANIPQNSVWSAMDYKPPRGKCNHKTSIISCCTCLRFMLHPVKAATSFDCDGCGHHASFHSLENPAEDAVLKKWSEQEVNSSNEEASAGATKKRKRIADKPADAVEIFEVADDDVFLTNASATATQHESVLAKRPSCRATKLVTLDRLL